MPSKNRIAAEAAPTLLAVVQRAPRRIEHWASAWARRRQGADPLGVTLKRRRIYILPTRFGFAFAVLVFAMLLGSLNYGANLGFALTFLLSGLLLVSMHHCHNNLLGASLRFAGAQPAFAGEHAQFRIAVGNGSAAARHELELRQGTGGAGPADVAPGETCLLHLHVRAPARGWLPLPRFTVSTSHPGRLFRAWAWIHMDARCLVYPQPAPPGRPLPVGPEDGGSRGSVTRGDSDFAGLRSAAAGDPPKRIAWKAYARTGELLAKQFAGSEQEARVLEWDALPELATEARLSQLTRWCLDATAEGRAFGLRLPGTHIALGSGEAHLHACLRALALFDVDQAAPAQ